MNYFLKKNKLENKYPLIQEGDKIKFCYLKLPNKLRSDVVSCLSKIPDEMNIYDIIDYKKQLRSTSIRFAPFFSCYFTFLN